MPGPVLAPEPKPDDGPTLLQLGLDFAGAPDRNWPPLRVFVITGMHRSGTSAVAELALSLGADLGDDGDLLPPAPDNPRGFFEHAEFKRVNDLVLETFGGTWDAPPALPHGWAGDESLDPLRQRGHALLDALASREADVVVLKDPRASLTLPFWRTVHRIDGTILPVRRPAAVAASLLRRNGMPGDASARLWWAYTTAALATDPDALLVSYAALLADPASVAARLAEHLGLPSPAAGTGEEVVDADLDHGDNEGPLGQPLRAAHRLHEQLIAGDDMSFLHDIALLARGTPHRDRRSLLTEQLRDARARVEARNQHIATLRQEIAKRTEEQAFFQARTARRELDLHDVREELRRTTQQAQDSARRDHDRAAELQRLTHQLQQERDVLARQLRRARTDFERLRGRRVVRASLKVASLARPLFRARRRAGAGTVDGPDAAALPRVGDGDGAASHHARLTFDPTSAPQQTVVTVVIPVHDAPEETSRCLEAVARNTSGPAEVVIVDDASVLEETRDLLADWARRDGVTVVRNDENLGFTKSVNRGLESCNTDVVILNSDTEVPPRWLQSLRIAAYSADDVGSATAISDDAGAFSVPILGERNEVPPHLGVDAAGRAVARDAGWLLPSAPTGNGFCMYLRRAMLDDVGVFDAEAFPVGYGEENDLSMRASRNGWRHVVADALYVRHAKGSTFGERRKQLMQSGRRVIDERYPEYTQHVRAFVNSPEMNRVRERVRASLWDRSHTTAAAGGARVLYVVHEGRGGTPATAQDLAEELSDRYDPLVLTSDTRALRLYRVDRSGRTLIEEHPLEPPLRFDEPHRDDVRRLIAELMVRHGVELLHVRHVIKNSLDVFSVAEDLAIPTVVSLHDFYLSCPTVHLLDDQDRFCGGVCTPGDGRCRIPMAWIADTAPHLKHDGVHEWRSLVGPHLQRAAALVTTSAQTRDVYLRSYPDLDPDRFHVIEHGRDLVPDHVGWTPPGEGDPIRILVPGNLDIHKGSDFLRRMLGHDTDNRIELHVLGELDDDQDELGIAHGAYERHEFADRVREIRPHLIGQFTMTAETYNHTLSEAWMTGVPVVATDRGALGERIRAHGGGFLVPPDDPAEALRRILAMADDPSGLIDAARLAERPLRTVGEMGEDYDELYTDVLAERRPLAQGRPLRIGMVVLGTRRAAPGSVQVRMLRPLSHPAIQPDAVSRIVRPEDLVEDPSRHDLVIVQRTALPAEELRGAVDALREHGVPLVVELDDLLFEPDLLPEGDVDWAPHAAGIRTLTQLADLVTVSTPTIAHHASDLNERVEVVANHLDERLWFSDVRLAEPPQDAPVRLLYAGSKTHHEDLQILRPAIEGLADRLGRPVVLDVIGGTPEDAPWFERLSIPPHTANYPEYARWLATVAPGHVAGLGPLVDSPFTRAKSDLKWLEYSAVGLPGVYSDHPAYASSVRNGVTGLLATEHTRSWVDAMARLVDDPEFGASLVAEARRQILRDRVLDRRVRERLDLYRSVIERRRVRA